MTEIRWETRNRYYAVRVYQDLFGDWVIHKVWGGLHNNLGNGDQQVARTFDDAVIALERICRERRSRLYEEVAAR